MSGSRQVVERYLRDVWQEGELAALERFLAPSYKRYLSPTAQPLDRAGQAERLAAIRTSFPDVTLTIEDLVADGDRVAFRSTMRGTHEGEFLGLAPTGRAFTAGVLDLVRVADGQLVEHWGGPDIFDLLRQIGVTFVLPD